MNRKNILITGGTGLIGRRLTEILLSKGYRVSLLGRKQQNAKIKSFVWDIERQELDEDAFAGVDAIIHLAGAGIAEKRWTAKRKQEILNSRIRSTRLLYTELKRRHHIVTTVVAASAVGYYGLGNAEKVFTETSEPGNDFLAEVTRQWENEINTLQEVARLVKLRVGVVLSEKGGALKEMIKPVKLFVGAPVGSGHQYLSWIHIDDLCNMFVKAIEDQTMQGTYNAVSPCPVTNHAFTKAIAAAVNRPLLLPAIPAFVLKLALGEMADLVLQGSKISSAKIQEAGFTFEFNTLDEALKDLIKR